MVLSIPIDIPFMDFSRYVRKRKKKQQLSFDEFQGEIHSGDQAKMKSHKVLIKKNVFPNRCKEHGGRGAKSYFQATFLGLETRLA